MSWQATKAEVRYPLLDPQAYHDARLVAPSYNVYYLARVARLVGREWDARTRVSRKGVCGVLQEAPPDDAKSLIPPRYRAGKRHAPASSEWEAKTALLWRS
jgi:hypothetical protein